MKPLFVLIALLTAGCGASGPDPKDIVYTYTDAAGAAVACYSGAQPVPGSWIEIHAEDTEVYTFTCIHTEVLQ